MCSSSDVIANANNCLKYIESAAHCGAKVIFLPECFLYISGGDAPASQPKPIFTLDHPIVQRFRESASACGVWLSLGGFPLKNEGPDTRAYNAHALIASDGSVAAVYKKIHLFDAAGKLSC
jgi:predicted amidohydrolase